jgi:peptidoglycan-associated lipoprotein
MWRNVEEGEPMRYIAGLVMLAGVLAGCVAPMPTGLAPVDIAGTWSGSWDGYGIRKIKRHDNADAWFTQKGTTGTGRLWLEGILASESIPLSMRLAGANGASVVIEVTGNRVRIQDPRDERIFAAEFLVHGDRMVGRVLSTEQPARIVLERVRPREAVVTPPSVVAPSPVATAPPDATASDAPPVAAALPVAAEPVWATPPAPRPAPQEFAPTDALKPVHFAFGGSNLEPSQTPVMDAAIQWLQANQNVLVIIEGHCDERGTGAYNLTLGERRARTVRDYLLAHGVAAARITLVSYGEERPSCPEPNEACWRENRRAAFVIKASE